MADDNRLAGFLSLTIDGRSYAVAGEGAYRLSANKRETLTGQDGVHGYSEMPQPGKIGWKGRDGGSTLIKAINEATDATLVMSLANGKVIVGRNMWRAGDPIEVNTEDATFAVEFEGEDVTEN
ncbi:MULTISPECIES: phage tail tube protein [Sphingomonas]|uniref:phage tail tube protein n=1 Tax=Sphingomonas TaxID=13687 RepID=UPI00083659FE|nr:phage tail tube protein [Sphingomonas sp. CCH10-B3]